MNLIFNLAGHIYGAGIKAAALFHPKAKKMVQGRRTDRLHLYDRIRHERQGNNAPVVWVHVSSLGEFEQGRPLMEEIRNRYPEVKIMLTFFSPSGYEVRRHYEGADWVTYLPADTAKNAHHFLDAVCPTMAVFVKYDLWPNFLMELHRRTIPSFLVSAIFRSNQLFFKPYGRWYLNLLRTFDRLFVQDEASKLLLEKHGINHIVVAGDTRFDRVLRIRHQAKDLPLIEAFIHTGQNSDICLVAGSSWPQDEAFLLPYFNSHPELKLIIAPHEIHESHLTDIEQKLTRKSVRYTQANEVSIAEADCIIMDCFGLLSSIYRYGQVAYVGGGFGKGIHNTPEAAVYGIPVLFGPNHCKFREAAGLMECGGGVCVHSGGEFAERMQRWSEQPDLRLQAGEAAGTYIAEQSHATERILPYWDSHLK